MVKTKLINTLASALCCACIGCISVQAQTYSWRRVMMDGSRTRVVLPDGSISLDEYKPLSGTPAVMDSILKACAPRMEYLKEVVGYAPVELRKARPSSPLSNWLADLMLVQGEKYSGQKCDISVNNFGGIRVDMPAGNVTVDDIRSMFPFKNYLVIVHHKGSKILEFIQRMNASQYEVLGGVYVEARPGEVTKVLIGGEPLQMDKEYVMVTNSFLLDGGDGLFMAEDALSVETLKEDFYGAVMDFVKTTTAQGGQIVADSKPRVVLTGFPARKNAGEVFSSDVDVAPRTKAAELTILHTNDCHSHHEPLRSGDQKGLCGIVERAAFIDSVRLADGAKNVLVLSAGDFDQGTSYFSVFGGSVEIETMNKMGYDATTMGNHEWDNGFDSLVGRLTNARFATLLCNYTFKDERLNKLLKPYTIIERGGRKIGIIGTLTDVTTAVDKKYAVQMKYLDPCRMATKWATYLKKKQKCDLVIVLSHCGTFAKVGEPVGDMEMAGRVRNVDIIIGGHTHTKLEQAYFKKGLDGKPVMVVTDWCWGMGVGEIKVAF